MAFRYFREEGFAHRPVALQRSRAADVRGTKTYGFHPFRHARPQALARKGSGFVGHAPVAEAGINQGVWPLDNPFEYRGLWPLTPAERSRPFRDGMCLRDVMLSRPAPCFEILLYGYSAFPGRAGWFHPAAYYRKGKIYLP